MNGRKWNGLSDVRAIAWALLESRRRSHPRAPEVSDHLCEALGFPVVKTSEHAHTIHHLLRWAQAGFPTFEITGGLMSALLLTDLRGQRGLRVPYPAFTIVLPTPNPFKFTDPMGRPTSGRWILVNRLRATRDDAKEKLDRMGSASLDAIKSLPTREWGYVHLVGDNDGGLFRKSWWPDDEEPLERWLTDTFNQDEWTDKDTAAGFAMLRLVANLSSYIASLPTAPKPQTCGSVNAPIGTVSRPKLFVIGREIKLPAPMHQAASDAVHGKRAMYRLHARFMVRGHWRQQACGKQRLERKPRWIQPFWKGPQAASALARMYRVAEGAPMPIP